MLFTDDATSGLADGSITLTFRTWKRPQAKVGGRFTKRDLRFAVDAVDRVPVEAITPAEARRAGEATVADVRRRLGDPPDGTIVWRVAFHRLDPAEEGPDLAEQAALEAEDVADLDRRLDRMDQRSPTGPWTRATLGLIGERPATVSTELAEALGRERMAFKADVRKLKALGLTRSLEVGYRLSPRGRAYLDAVTGRR